jgi:flagellar assembly factor FliW
MAVLRTSNFGELEYEPEAVFTFCGGIPGFEDRRQYVFVERPQTHPLVFMQSLEDSELCFIAVPAFAADPAYRLELSSEDCAALDLPDSWRLEMGADLACLALVSSSQSGTTANLASPIVLNVRARRGVQSIRSDTTYSLRQPLTPVSEEASC